MRFRKRGFKSRVRRSVRRGSYKRGKRIRRYVASRGGIRL